MSNCKKVESNFEEFLELCSKLDEFDKARVIERMKTLLDNEKYSAKQRILDRTDNIITVNFK